MSLPKINLNNVLGAEGRFNYMIQIESAANGIIVNCNVNLIGEGLVGGQSVNKKFVFSGTPEQILSDITEQLSLGYIFELTEQVQNEI